MAEWYLPYEATFAAGSRMHVCMGATCGCEDCCSSATIRLRSLIDRSEPSPSKPASWLDTVAEAFGGEE